MMFLKKRFFKPIIRMLRPVSTVEGPDRTRENPCYESIKMKIQMSGPLTISDYMKESLLNPSFGYYMTRNVFGQSGDFTTSPEISQLFGEMIAVWCINEWHKLGAPSPYFLVELGPGRGTMMKDILRVFNKVGMINVGLSVHLVEISDELSKLQAENICESFTYTSASPHYMKGITSSGVPIHWYKSIHLIPKQFSSIIAHEFFDALPIHKFKKTENGWREILVDIDPKNDKLRFVLAKSPTPAVLMFAKDDCRKEQMEISPQSGEIMQYIASRFEGFGGFLLVADYGHNGEKEDTFRSFQNHRQVHPLFDPGRSDLTADVDFSYLKSVVANKLITLGPVTQHDFLQKLQIDVRLENLIRNCKSEIQKDAILSNFHMIMDKDKMGDKFKFVAFFPSVLKEFIERFPVIGFENF